MEYFLEKSADGTTKIIFSEGYIGVIIPSKFEKNTFCVSCQIGCPVGCKICRSGKIKFERNLTMEEMFSQVLVAKEIIGKKPTSIVFMGVGEPTLNLENVLKTAEKINKELGISRNKITISTSCLKNLDKLKNCKFNLALSLHSPFDKKRKEIIPSSCSVRKIVNFANDYVEGANNKKYIMIEYVMIKSFNDSEKDLKKLSELKWPKKTLFNLIEFNDFENFKSADFEILLHFKDVLMKKWKCFIRRSMGRDISASCGMLSSE